MTIEVGSAIYTGSVRHRRFSPMKHEFRYRLYMVCLNLEQLESQSEYPSARLLQHGYKRSDHLGEVSIPLSQAVSNLVMERLGFALDGPILLLTNLRNMGHVINPVSFYYCVSADLNSIVAIVAEINNTPWGERYCYVLDRRGGNSSHDFPKVFHVSPFMPMDQNYLWKFSEPSNSISVHMENLQDGTIVFDATLALRRISGDSANRRKVHLTYPMITFKVLFGIYFQALILWLKRCPYYPHPRKIASINQGPQS